MLATVGEHHRRPTHLEEALARHGIIPHPTDLDFSERRCETTNGTAIVPDAVVQAAIRGHVRRVVLNSAGVVIEVSRKRRLFTGAAHTQIDHLDEWERDHRTGHIIYYRPDGTPMLAVGRRHPDNLPEPTETDEQMLIRLARTRAAALRPAA